MNDSIVVLVIVLIVVAVWRGPRNLPAIGRVFGRGVRSARDEVDAMRKGGDPPSDRAHG